MRFASMSRSRVALRFLAVVAVLPAWALVVDGTTQSGKQEPQVKLSATATPIGGDGKQTLTIKMAINEGWYAYANPVKLEDLEAAQTVVKIESANKLQKVAIAYPKGYQKFEEKNPYYVYKGTIEIKAEIERAPGDAGPLSVRVRYQTCNVQGFCLPPETVTLQVK